MARRTHIPGSPRRREGAAALLGWGCCGRGFAGASPPSPAGQRRHLALCRGCCSALACSLAPLPPFSPPLSSPSLPPPPLPTPRSRSLSLSPPLHWGAFFSPPSSSLSLSEGSCQDAKLEIAAPDAFCAARRGSSFAGCCQWKDWQDPAGLPRPGPTSGRAPRFPRPSPALRGSSAPAPGLQSPPSHLRSAPTFCMC